jgi:ParB/RepB/Spo0J family partition protein
MLRARKVRYENIPLEKIKGNEYRFRSDLSKENLEPLVNSFKELGQTVPIKVLSIGKNYKIIAGHRRFEAGKIAGLKTIKAEVYENLTEDEALKLNAVDNFQRKDLSTIDQARLVKYFIEERKMDIKSIANLFGCNERRVRDLLRVNSFHPLLFESLEDGNLSFYQAVEIDRAPELRKIQIMWEAIDNNWSVSSIKRERMYYSNHPYLDGYTELDKEDHKNLFHAVKFIHTPRIDQVFRIGFDVIEHIWKEWPLQCEIGEYILALNSDPPFRCHHDIDWAITMSEINTNEGLKNFLGRKPQPLERGVYFLCDPCSKLVFPNTTYHPNLLYRLFIDGEPGQPE